MPTEMFRMRSGAHHIMITHSEQYSLVMAYQESLSKNGSKNGTSRLPLMAPRCSGTSRLGCQAQECVGNERQVSAKALCKKPARQLRVGCGFWCCEVA